MRKTVFIRNASFVDFPCMESILQSGSRDWSSAQLKDCFQSDYDQWVIGTDEHRFGFLIVRNNAMVWEIMQLVIDPLQQRQGLATRLLNFLIRHAKKNQIEKIQLEVRASNQAAIALYQNNGFQNVGVRKKYYTDGEDALLMDHFL